MRDVYVIGVGLNDKWGELWGMSFRDVFVDAALNAFKEAKLDRIDSMYIGCMSGGLFVGQEHVGALMADYLGMAPVPATRVEAACASGGCAIRAAFMEVAGGMNDIVLAGGVEKMNDIGGDGATYALSAASDMEYEAFHGATFPGLYAMMANDHMRRFGTTREMLSAVAVKNHDNGSKNPVAQFPFKTTIEGVTNAVAVADPLTLMDCSPITDGGAVVILGTKEMAEKAGVPLIRLSGVGMATDALALSQRPDYSWITSAEIAGKRAFEMAGKSNQDIDLIEVHDCFTISELMVLESMGFFERGKAGPATLNGATALTGPLPVNTSGGLKSKGHPVGATGVAQVIEVVKQLRGEAGERQVLSPKVGMTQNMGGTGATSVCTILEVM